MKGKTIVILLGIFLLTCPLQARKAAVKVKTPGTLSTLIAPGKKNKITELSLQGALNGTDLRFLREMAGSDLYQKPTEGQLRKVDLSKATFALGGEAYIEKESLRYPTGPYTIPKFLFRNSRIEEVILPQRTDTIGVGAFEYSGLEQIRLPENVVLCDWAFNACTRLREVVFPSHIPQIAFNCFSGCKALKHIALNNVNVIAYNSFIGLDSLESFEVKGILEHIDGWAIKECPRLQSVDFYGLVMTTGDPILVENCQVLRKVTFHDLVVFTNSFGGEGCPMLQDYTLKGMAFYSANENVPQVSQATLRENPRYWRFLEELDSICSNRAKPPFLRNAYADALYFGACAYAVRGENDKALKMLERAVATGYSDYKRMPQEAELASIRDDARYTDLLERVREKWDYIYLLQKSAPYERTETDRTPFTYAEPTDSSLVRIRDYFNLDSIAGQGDEFSRMKNLLYWLHDSIRHDGGSFWPQECNYNVIDLYKLAKQQNRGYNCRFMAMMLNEIYLAAGFKSRFLTCESKEYDTDGDCHVINMVWSRTLQKWVWMDPTFAAYVTDENGLLLHPGEVRERLAKGFPLVLNEDANWNHQERQTKEDYLERYMAKNLYLITAHVRSECDTESKERNSKSPSITLSPSGFLHKWTRNTHDDAYFWQKPE